MKLTIIPTSNVLQKESLLPNVLVKNTCKNFILPPQSITNILHNTDENLRFLKVRAHNLAQIHAIYPRNVHVHRLLLLVYDRAHFISICIGGAFPVTTKNTWAIVGSSFMNGPGHNHMGLVYMLYH